MALIKCPECGKEISSKTESCPNCGCPHFEWEKMFYDNSVNSFVCFVCHSKCEQSQNFCKICGNILKRNFTQNANNPVSNPVKETTQNPKKEFTGIYRVSFFGKKEEVYCPKCRSSDCSWFNEQKVIPGKTKTRYTANLNPLHPLTLVNKKEKVIKKEEVQTVNKIICNSCGKVFE